MENIASLFCCCCVRNNAASLLNSRFVFFKLQIADAADEKLANFLYANNVSFSSVDTKSLVELADAPKSAPPTYKKPDRKALSGELVGPTEKRINAAKYEHSSSIEKYGTALATGGASVHLELLSTYVLKVRNVPKPIHLGTC